MLEATLGISGNKSKGVRRSMVSGRAAQGLLGLLLLPACLVRAEQAPAKATDLFPESTLAALWIPDLTAARVAASKTRLAEMFAQPELQAFLQPAQDEIQKVYGELRAKSHVLPALGDLDQGLLSGEIIAGLYARPVGSMPPVGVLVILRPKDPAAFKRLLPAEAGAVLALLSGEPVPLGPAPNDPALVFAGGQLLLCAPKEDLQAVLLRQKDPALGAKDALSSNKDFAAVRGKLSASAALLYLAPKRAADLAFMFAAAMGDRDAPRVQAALKALGIDRLSSLGLGAGFSGPEPVLESFLLFNAPPTEGLCGLFHSVAPPSEAAFKIVPPDAPYVGVGYFNLGGLLPLVRKTVEAVQPRMLLKMDLFTGLARQFLGFDLQKDLLENLGGEMVTVQTVLDTGAPLSFMPGLVCSMPAKNPAKVEACLKQLGPALLASPLGTAGVLKMKRIEHRGKAIYYLGGQVFAGPAAFAIVGERLLVGTSVNAIRRTLEQLEKPENILGNKGFQEVLARLSGKPFDAKAMPASFSYAIDRGSGAGSLAMAGLWLLAEAAGVAGAAELPQGLAALSGAQPGAAPARLAANEAAASVACKSYAEAQDLYRRTDWDADGVLEYAQGLAGENSLFERKAGAGDLALIDKAFATAEGNPGGKENKAGYRFKVLKGQGESAPGGKKSYVVAGEGRSANSMTLGYAFVAYPDQYGVTGKQTFQINNTGTVYAKDLGEKTAELISAMDAYAPDVSWKIADAEAAEEEEEAGPNLFRNPMEAFASRPSAQVALRIAGAIDLSLWPDEGFFAAYRRPTGALTVFSSDGIHWRSELPLPGPALSGGMNPMVVTAGVAIVAAIAIPNLLRSRMAANEAAAFAACRTYCEAQDIYRRTDWDGDGILEYAQALKGNHSLYEKTAGAGDLTLVDAAFARAEGEPGVVPPKAGYVFKVLTGQGPKAPGGRKSYVINGNMTLGYALVASPASWDGTARHTFIINNTGTAYQKDLGAETAKMVKEMTEYNPDETWVVTE